MKLVCLSLDVAFSIIMYPGYSMLCVHSISIIMLSRVVVPSFDFYLCVHCPCSVTLVSLTLKIIHCLFASDGFCCRRSVDLPRLLGWGLIMVSYAPRLCLARCIHEKTMDKQTLLQFRDELLDMEMGSFRCTYMCMPHTCLFCVACYTWTWFIICVSASHHMSNTPGMHMPTIRRR